MGARWRRPAASSMVCPAMYAAVRVPKGRRPLPGRPGAGSRAGGQKGRGLDYNELQRHWKAKDRSDAG